MTTIADRFARLHNFVDVGFNRLYDQLDRIEGKIDTMTVNQQDFDVDLEALLAAVNTLITNPKVVDLSKEDAEVKAALAQIQAAGGTPTP